tara:strand:- start:60 stop:404 length:345 start_codon:yes stop_codon:yes gene_type:complete
MPSLILHVDEIIENTLKNSVGKAIEKNMMKIIQKELEAEKHNCQIIWVRSKILSSNYKIFGELKFREKNTRNIKRRKDCLKQISEILQKEFNVSVRLRAFSIKEESITALDFEN